MNKQKTKAQKGITLVALIITIIVLLILAVVSIRAVKGDGIISHAKNARTEYEQAQANESAMLDSYLAQLDDATKVKWTQNKTTVTKGDIILKVGDYVDYKANVSGYTDENGWRVLGAENGELLLISASNVVDEYILTGGDCYLNGASKLNTACEPYKNAECATLARSVNVDDINRVTGYNPKTGGYASTKIYRYGNEVTYTLLSTGKITYSATDGTSGEFGGTSLKKPDGTVLTVDDPIKLTSTAYYYYPNTLTTKDTGTENGIKTSENAYKTLFLKMDGTSQDEYWLASPYILTDTTYVTWGLRMIKEGNVSTSGWWYNTSNNGTEYKGGIRAVVSLIADVEIVPDGSNSWKLSY